MSQITNQEELMHDINNVKTVGDAIDLNIQASMNKEANDDVVRQISQEAIMSERASYINRCTRDSYNQYYKKIHNDIKDIIEAWCREVGVKSPVCYNISNSDNGNSAPTMIIYTVEVDKLLGKANEKFDKYSEWLDNYFNNQLDNSYIILVNPMDRFVNLNVYEGPDFQ